MAAATPPPSAGRGGSWGAREAGGRGVSAVPERRRKAALAKEALPWSWEKMLSRGRNAFADRRGKIPGSDTTRAALPFRLVELGGFSLK